MESYWRERRAPGLAATFIVERTRSNGLIQIKIMTEDELLPNDRVEVYSLQHGQEAQDTRVLATINAKLFVRPACMPDGMPWIHPDEREKTLSAAMASPLLVPIAVKAEERASSDGLGIAGSTLPSKSPAKTDGSKAAPKKRSRLSAFIAPKPKTVDLKAKLDAEMFTAEDKPGRTSMSEEKGDESGDGMSLDDVPPGPRQSFVTFSSDDEDELDRPTAPSPEALPPSSPMHIDSPVIVDNSSTPRETPPSSGPRMKMIKVPRTFMENGYLSIPVHLDSALIFPPPPIGATVVTEMVTEMVPDDDAAVASAAALDETRPGNEKAAPRGAPAQLINTDRTDLKNGAAKDPQRKQGSLLAFFKPKQQ